ncbi:MAG: MoxR family ATPase [Spirochaetes bacterium]|jgi:MoxR-like ATPase|nr:MoxR family ATPase [Spirochaetota bacterium]
MDYAAIEKLTEKVKSENGFIGEIKSELSKVIIGQENLLDRMIIAFMSGGHILLEGLPGLAKTLAVRSFAKCINTDFMRVQFTPDLLPADLIGTRIYNPKDLDFFTKKGPIFTNLLLADEINRAPAKVQSALLQAMEEKQVSIGEETHSLDSPFMVMATENPIEQEGTYPLPEAQLDRFFMKVLVGYPGRDEERQILTRFGELDVANIRQIITPEKIFKKSKIADSIYMDEKLVDYIVSVAGETRNPGRKELKKYIEYGASPRASIALMKAAKCVAFMRGRGFATPDDVKEIGADVLRHRIILSYEAEADGRGPDDVVRMIFDSVEVP